MFAEHNSNNLILKSSVFDYFSNACDANHLQVFPALYLMVNEYGEWQFIRMCETKSLIPLKEEMIKLSAYLKPEFWWTDDTSEEAFLKQCFPSLRDDITAYASVKAKDAHICRNNYPAYDIQTCDRYCKLLRDDYVSKGKTTFGFDMEWPVISYTKGAAQEKAATIQIGTGDTAWIFCLGSIMQSQPAAHQHKFPASLAGFLGDAGITFVGCGIDNDVKKLTRDFPNQDLYVRNKVMLNVAAERAVQARADAAGESRPGRRSWNLSQLAREFTDKDVTKFAHLQRSPNWASGILDQV